MSRYRKILVAYDGSEAAKSALKAAIKISKEDKSWLKLLAVIPSFNGDLDLTSVKEPQKLIDGPGQKMVTEALAIAKSEDCYLLADLEQGEPFEKIIEVADRENCDLIVLGRRGNNRIERELMGHVSAGVIEYAGKDVLVVPCGSNLSRDNILLAVDLSGASRQATDLAIQLAKQRSVDLSVVSVLHTNEEFFAIAQDHYQKGLDQTHQFLKEVQGYIEQQGVNACIFTRAGDPHEEITTLARELNSGLIVLGIFEKNRIQRVLVGSVAVRTIGYAQCPVMVAQ